MTEHKANTRTALIALLPSWVALAWLVSRAQWFWSTRPDLQFGWIVLLLSLFLIWDNWANRPPVHFALRPLGVIAALLGLAVVFTGQIYMAAFGMNAASLLGLSLGILSLIAANVQCAFGRPGLRHFAFPFLFLLIALPLPSMIYNPIVNGLQAKVASVNVEVMNLFGVPATKVGSLIQLPNGTVGVDEACSGIRSLQSTVMATLFIGYLTLKSRVLQVALFGSGIALAIVGNLGRSLFLSFTAHSKGLKAIEGIHDAAGWSILLFTAAGVGLLAWLMARLEKAAAALPPET